MSPIRIDKSFRASNVIVTPDSVRALVEIILEAAKELPPQKQFFSQRFSISATTADGLKYSSESPELCEDDGVLDRKQIESINLSFGDHTNDAHIDIELSQKGSEYELSVTNRIRISGTDSTWVSGISEKLRVAVSEFKAQEGWPRAYYSWLFIISALSFGSFIQGLGSFVFTNIVRIVIKIPVLDIAPGYALFWWAVLVAWIFLLGSPFAGLLMNYLTELWPPVEFQMGRDWMQVLPRRKKRIRWFVTAVVVPLLVRTIYEALKHYALL